MIEERKEKTEEHKEKIKVTSFEIIVVGSTYSPYYAIKYLEVGSDDYAIGYGSYNLKYVFDWGYENFDIVKDRIM